MYWAPSKMVRIGIETTEKFPLGSFHSGWKREIIIIWMKKYIACQAMISTTSKIKSCEQDRVLHG